MTAVTVSDASDLHRVEQLESLRRRMDSMSGKFSGKAAVPADDLLPESESQLAVPQWLAEALPTQLPRGTVAVLSGAGHWC